MHGAIRLTSSTTPRLLKRRAGGFPYAPPSFSQRLRAAASAPGIEVAFAIAGLRSCAAASKTAYACPEILAKFVLAHDAVIGLVGVSDRVLRFVSPQAVEFDDLVIASPGLRLAVLSVRDRLADSEEVRTPSEGCPVSGGQV